MTCGRGFSSIVFGIETVDLWSTYLVRREWKIERMALHLVFARDVLTMAQGIWEAMEGSTASVTTHTAHLSGVVAGLLFCLWRHWHTHT